MVGGFGNGGAHGVVIGLCPPCEGVVQAVTVGRHVYDGSRVGGLPDAGASQGVRPRRSSVLAVVGLVPRLGEAALLVSRGGHAARRAGGAQGPCERKCPRVCVESDIPAG